MAKRLQNITAETLTLTIVRDDGFSYDKVAGPSRFIVLNDYEFAHLTPAPVEGAWIIEDAGTEPPPPPPPPPFGLPTTDELPEGVVNLYFTTSRAKVAVVDDSITSSVHDKAPSESAVAIALATKAALSLATPSMVANMENAGTALDASRSDHVHKGVASIEKLGESALFGNITMTGAGSVTLNQVGNNIEINGGGSGLASTDDLPEGAINLYYHSATAKSDCVADAIVDMVTDVAPSQNAVFDALVLKQNAAFSPSTPTDWAGSPPTTIEEALNRIAAALTGLTASP